MREIKFRMFDTLEKQFMNDSRVLESKLWALQDNERFIYQQYTGLRDKNGKEIYEGDIVKWTRLTFADCSRTVIEKSEDIVGEVYWAETMWAIGDRNRGYLLLPHFKHDVFEVIGNIYENPELLEGTQDEEK
jgi:uncharacterized phage protein (TIGR01671 family)